jgi:hypothetical protein
MPTICSYINPCSDEFRALKDFSNLPYRQKITIALITTLFAATIIFAIPVFRYLVGRCTVTPSISTNTQSAFNKTVMTSAAKVALSQNSDILVDNDSLTNRKEISKELADYEMVGIINVEEKQYGITHSKSDYPILSTHNLLTCFSIVCYDQRNHIASLSHYQSLENMMRSLVLYQKHLQEMYDATGSALSEGRFRISIVCGMPEFAKNRQQDLQIAQREIINLLQKMGTKVISVHTDIHKCIAGKSIAVDTRTGLVFSHTPVLHQSLCTNTTWKPKQKEVFYFAQSDEMRARLKPWIKDSEKYPAAVRANSALQRMKNCEDLMSVTLEDLLI